MVNQADAYLHYDWCAQTLPDDVVQDGVSGVGADGFDSGCLDTPVALVPGQRPEQTWNGRYAVACLELYPSHTPLLHPSHTPLTHPSHTPLMHPSNNPLMRSPSPPPPPPAPPRPPNPTQSTPFWPSPCISALILAGKFLLGISLTHV